MTKTPDKVLSVLEKLDASDKGIVLDYIKTLQSGAAGDDDDDDAMEEEAPRSRGTTSTISSNEAPFPPVYESGEDFDMAADLKQQALDCSHVGDWEGAMEKYTAAILAARPSSLLYANRANALLHLHRPMAAERDCDLALQENPDSAKALRTRGKARKALGKWEDALHDLSAAQQIDFDEDTVQDLKEATDKHLEQEKAEAAERNDEHDRLVKKAAEIKKAQKEAKEKEAAEAAARSASSARGMPGGGMGGMPGGMPPGAEGLMGSLLSDPELMAAMQNPKVQAAFQELMSGPGGPMGLMANPAKLQEIMADPEVGPIMGKIMAKLGGGMGGMPGGASAPSGGDDEMPDLDAMPDLE